VITKGPDTFVVPAAGAGCHGFAARQRLLHLHHLRAAKAWHPHAALAAVTAAGTAVTKPIIRFPGGRRFHFRDPSGNELSAMQADAD
jgi:predicted enzyme related to lactoylglutathione lyase